MFIFGYPKLLFRISKIIIPDIKNYAKKADNSPVSINGCKNPVVSEASIDVYLHKIKLTC